MKSEQISYLDNTVYIYDDNDNVIAVYHVDTDIMLPSEECSYTEEELKDLVWGIKGGHQMKRES